MRETCQECVHFDDGMCKLKPGACLNYGNFRWSPMVMISPSDLENKYVSRISYDSLLKRAEVAEAKVAELEAAARWVPVEEGYPVEDGTYYDVVIRYVFKKPFVDVAIWQAGVFYTMRSEDWNDKDHEYITHYRPRPQPPQEDLK